jgi:hypothetical protein
MTAPHHLIAGSRVEGQLVYSDAGEKLGKIADLIIDKASGRTTYALMAFDGFLGMGQRYYPVPWSLLAYDPKRHGYVVPLSRSLIEAGHHVADNEVNDEIRWRESVHQYYGAAPYW